LLYTDAVLLGVVVVTAGNVSTLAVLTVRIHAPLPIIVVEQSLLKAFVIALGLRLTLVGF
jgi:hypothetical protein